MPTSSWACGADLGIPGHAHEDVGMAPNVGNAKPRFVVVTMSSDKNCRRLAPLALRVKKSPFSAMMGVATNHDSPWFRKNGDESSKDAEQVAATAVVDREPATVSHPPGLEASPTGGAPRAFMPSVGPPAVGLDHDGDDLGGRGFTSREVRDGTRILRDVLLLLSRHNRSSFFSRGKRLCE
jgi:hypothetical protein